MKIAVVEFAGRGGLIHYAFQLCRALAAQGADVTLVTDRHYELDALPHPFRLVKLLRLWDPKPGGLRTATPGGRIGSRLRRAVRAVVYYREWLRLARWLARARFDAVLLGDIRFATDLAPVYLLRATGQRLADICHNVRPFAAGGAASGGFRRSRLDRVLYRRLYHRFDRVFVHFERNRAAVLETFGLRPERVVCVPHGNELLFEELRDPSLDARALRTSLSLEPDAPVVLFFGTLARYKGVDLLLEAFAEVHRAMPGARLVIAGFPHADFALEAHRVLAARLGLEGAVRIEPRYLASGEIAAWMALASVAVFPYREVYQSGALAVAMTFGVPVVGTRVGAIPDVVDDGVSGLLVPPGDVPALAAAIARLVGDRDLARRLGARAATDARDRFGWDGVATAVLQALDSAITTGHR